MAKRKKRGLMRSLRARLRRMRAGAASFFSGAAESIKQFMPRRGRPRGVERAVGKGSAALLASLIVLAVAGAAFFAYAVTKPDGRLDVTLVQSDVRMLCRVRPGGTVAELLQTAGVTLGSGDAVSVPVDTSLADGMTVEVTRAFPVAVQSGGSVQVLHMTDGTVGDALRRAGVACAVEDELSALPYQAVEPGMRITHTAVQTDYKISYKTLEYDDVVIKDDDEYEDYRKVEVEGVDGKKQITQRITVKDGIEVSREVVDQVVLNPAVDKVIRVGTKIKYQTNYKGETRRWKAAPVEGENGWKKMVVDKITAYCTGTRTSRGTRPALGTIAVNTHYISYYSEIYVKGYGYGKALDTGAFRNYTNSKGEPMNQLDLWFNTRSEAMHWGTKYNVTIWVKPR